MCEMCLKEPCDPRCPGFHEYRVGYCEKCGAHITNDDERWEDADDNLFCCQTCAIEYHKIHEVRA